VKDSSVHTNFEKVQEAVEQYLSLLEQLQAVYSVEQYVRTIAILYFVQLEKLLLLLLFSDLVNLLCMSALHIYNI
jgi:hypothetical protein